MRIMKWAGLALVPLGLTLLLAREGGAQQVTDSQSNHSQDRPTQIPGRRVPFSTMPTSSGW